MVKNGEKLQCSVEMLNVSFQCMFFKLGHKYILLYANTHLLSSLYVLTTQTLLKVQEDAAGGANQHSA